MQLLWFLPTHGDGRYLGFRDGGRAPTSTTCAGGAGRRHARLRGRAAAHRPLLRGSLGGRARPGAGTKQLQFLVALRPGIIPPVHGRAHGRHARPRCPAAALLINVVTGGDPEELPATACTWPRRALRADRRVRGDLARACMRARRSTSKASTSMSRARMAFPPVQQPYPPLCFGGSSAAGTISPPSNATSISPGASRRPPSPRRSDVARRRPRKLGRTLEFGIRLHVIVRETREAAWDAAGELISHLDDEIDRRGAEDVRGYDSVGQRRMAALHGGRPRASSRSAPTCGPASAWCAAAPARRWWATRTGGGAHAGIRDLGMDNFILSGYPHLEEAYRFAELVFPLLPLSHAREAGRAADAHRPVRRDRRQRHPPKCVARSPRERQSRRRALPGCACTCRAG